MTKPGRPKTPCRKCGGTKRNANGNCVPCYRIYMREYRAKWRKERAALPAPELVIADGVEADGITYRVHQTQQQWVCTVTAPDGKVLTEGWEAVEPGKIAPGDGNMADLVMDKLINTLRGI